MTKTGANARLLVGVVGFVFFVDMLALGIVVPVLPSLARSAGLDFLGVGLLFACYGLAYFILTPVVGWLVDSRGSRPVFLAGAILLTLSTVFFCYASSPAGLVTSRMLQGAGAAVTWVSGQATLIEMFPESQRGRVVGTANIGTALGVLLGPAAGGLLLETLGRRAPFLLGAVLAGAAVVVLAAVLPRSTPDRRSTANRGPFPVREASGRAAPWLLAGLAAGLALGAVEATLPIDGVARLHVSGVTTGLMFALTTAAFIVASQVAGRMSDGGRRVPVLAAGWVTLGVALAFSCVPSTLVVQAIVLIFLGSGLGVMNATVMPALADAMDAVGAQRPGTTAAAYNLCFSAGTMTGAPLAGWLADMQSFRVATALIAMSTLACGLLATLAYATFARRESKLRKAANTRRGLLH
ncbi:MFS transporter [Mycobacterium riyadhense]|uniref:Transport protein n=1 Tax=Mycobacterium riyadhense TaxID=486698 RepID=A0A1X2BIB4_9MYCO|nr:MFS transporter [Mycobacterium riyadhense]MCV7145519.1 MFS transporter [Mycobacterium riyadhense]ORW63385.1 transport protein [Mycobacterium riyadhense]